MDAHLRAGIAVYNAGQYHAAHDAWEGYWLELDSGDAAERFLHGLIQFTAVVHHATNENWSGAQGLAESAGEYLAALPADYCGVNLDTVRPFLDRVAVDPSALDWDDPPALRCEGVALTYDDLDFEATTIAADVLAETAGYDEAVIEDAIRYAHRDLESRGEGQFVGLLFSFVRETAKRPAIASHLGAHVERERRKDDDVAGLFE